MNRRFLVACLAVLWAVSCVVNAGRAVERYRRPAPRWMETLTRNWDEYASAATMCGILSIACVIYLRRTRRRPGPAATGEARARPVRWRDRVELRLGIYCLAWFAALQLSLDVFRAVRIWNGPRPSSVDALKSAIPPGLWMGPIAAVAVVVYDRRRLTREFREDAGQCVNCGYDLRATPKRCPECGEESP